MVVEKHHSLFLQRLNSLIHKVNIFGTHFATIDIRQDSRIHTQVLNDINKTQPQPILPDNYASLSEEEKINILSNIKESINPSLFEAGITKDTIESIYAIKTIQHQNGEAGCNRYVISLYFIQTLRVAPGTDADRHRSII